MNIKNLRLLHLGLALLVFTTQAACQILYLADAIEAKVVDAETNQPVEGVVVVAHWQLEGGLEGGSNLGQMMVMEAVTDKTGRFYFPAWGPKAIPSGLPGNARLKNMDPELLLFKNDYRYLRLLNDKRLAEMSGKTPYVRKSDWNGKTVRLEKQSKNLEDELRRLSFLNTDLDFATHRSSRCAWMQLPKALSEIIKYDEKFKQEIKKTFSTLIPLLMNNDTYFLQQGCASPKKFLEFIKK